MDNRDIEQMHSLEDKIKSTKDRRLTHQQFLTLSQVTAVPEDVAEVAADYESDRDRVGVTEYMI